MEEPIYIFKGTEEVYEPDEHYLLYFFIVIGWIFAGTIKFLCVINRKIIFPRNLYIPWTVFIFILFIITIFANINLSAMISYPVELRYYGDFLIFYRTYNHPKLKNYNRQYIKINYRDIEKTEYKKVLEKIYIYGSGVCSENEDFSEFEQFNSNFSIKIEPSSLDDFTEIVKKYSSIDILIN